MNRIQTVIQQLTALERVKKRPLIILETGSIRFTAKEYVEGDGHSTYFIAKFLSTSDFNHTFYSIDLNTSVAEKYLESNGLAKYVSFLKGDSLELLAEIGSMVSVVDLAYLDSKNDAQHILNEFKLVEKVMSNGVVIIDDVNLQSPELKKGDLAVPYARKRYEVEVLTRQAVIKVVKHDSD